MISFFLYCDLLCPISITVAVHNAIPFIGFGFLDNFLMIICVSKPSFYLVVIIPILVFNIECFRYITYKFCILYILTEVICYFYYEYFCLLVLQQDYKIIPNVFRDYKLT